MFPTGTLAAVGEYRLCMHGILGHQEGIRAFPGAENKPNRPLGRTVCLTPTNHSGEPVSGERASARSGAWCRVGGRVGAGGDNDTAVSPGAWRYTQTGGRLIQVDVRAPWSAPRWHLEWRPQLPPGPPGTRQPALRPSESHWPHRCPRTPGIF